MPDAHCKGTVKLTGWWPLACSCWACASTDSRRHVGGKGERGLVPIWVCVTTHRPPFLAFAAPHNVANSARRGR
jgi:hypothetical protein